MIDSVNGCTEFVELGALQYNIPTGVQPGSKRDALLD